MIIVITPKYFRALEKKVLMLCKQSYCTVAMPAIASYEGSALPSHAQAEQCFTPALGYHLNNNVKFCILFHTHLFPYILFQLLINSF